MRQAPKISKVLVSDFHFELPEALIAQQPPADRAGARMLALNRTTATWQDTRFTAFPSYLSAGDVLVLNNSRVLPARLYAHRPGATGKVEVLLTEQISAWEWKALVKPGKKIPIGERLIFLSRHALAADELMATITDRGDYGERTLRFTPTAQSFLEVLEAYGHIPLPPYIRREDTVADRDRYQTVYAEQPGSVAVPTAGLHFTPEILDQLRAQGVHICYITLHVGLGTFQPLRVERLEDIRLHSEHYTLPADTAQTINQARAEGRRIIAAGTTTVRTLEHCAFQQGDSLIAHSGSTSIFISPGHRFRIVDALLTNFHLPQSSLLMLVSAFAGHRLTLDAYHHAVANQYRFFSYGDCMFIY